MFAMLNGALPRVTLDGTDLAALEAAVAAGSATPDALEAAVDRCVAELVAAQVEAGVDLVTDGQVRWRDLGAAVLRDVDDPPAGDGPTGLLAAAWRATAALTDRAVAQAVPGPYSLGRQATGGPNRPGSAARRRARTLSLADALAVEIGALAEAGCPVVVVEEPAAVRIGTNAGERRLFADAQRRLLAQTPDLHAMLAINGGSAADAGADAIFAAPYRSHLFDLIAGPDNWALVRAAPADRGIVCGALRAGPGAVVDQAPVLMWAAGYAASSGGRGPQRVGLSNATRLADLAPADALAAIRGLGRAAGLATMTAEQAIAAGVDRRAFTNQRRPPTPGRRPPTPGRRRRDQGAR